tara:strand:+ start:1989 stop:3620 length:1632 start_codon:yes stop_codon:yes gene_type:complete
MSLSMGTSNIGLNRAMNKISDAIRPILVLNKNSGANLYNGAYWNSTYPGRLYFDGTNDYCRIEDVIVHRTSQGSSDRTLKAHMGDSSNDNRGTINFWWKLPYGHTETGFLFSINTSTGGNVALFGLNSNKPRIYVSGPRYSGSGTATDDWTGTTTISPNTWYMYTIVLTGSFSEYTSTQSGFDFYINGSLNRSYDPGSVVGGSKPIINLSTNDRWSIAHEWDTNSPSDWTKGECQHVAIWDVPLSPGAIEILYNDGYSNPPSIVMGTPNYISSWNATTIGCPVPTHRITNSTSSINKYNTDWYNNTWIFNGSSAYVRLEGAIGSTFQGSGIMSFSCWVWHENSSSSASDVIYSDHEVTSNRNLHKVDGPTGLFRYYYNTGDMFRFYKHMEYNWTHYAFVKNGGNYKMYINGKQIEEGLVEYRSGSFSTASGYSFTTWPSTPASNWRFSLGHEWDSNASDFFKGMLKNVHFWSTELTDEQVANVFRAEFGRSGMSMSDLRKLQPIFNTSNTLLGSFALPANNGLTGAFGMSSYNGREVIDGMAQ